MTMLVEFSTAIASASQAFICRVISLCFARYNKDFWLN